MKNLVAIDIETSGTNPFIHDALAIAFAPINPEIPNLEIFISQHDLSWSEYAKNNFPKFSKSWEANSVQPKEAIKIITKYLSLHFNGEKVTAVSHNVGFDIAFLRKLAFQADLVEIPFLSHRAIDTHTLLHAVNSKRKNNNPLNLTSDAAFDNFGITTDPSSRHTALADAIATRELYIKLIDELSFS